MVMNTASSEIIYTVLGLLGFVGIIGAAVAYFSKGRADALIRLQETEITTLKEINERLQKERDELIKINDNYHKKILSLDNEIKTLRSAISQAPAINELAQNIAAQHTEVTDTLSKLAGVITTAIQQREEQWKALTTTTQKRKPQK